MDTTMDTSAWVTRPERPKGAKDEVKQARRAQSRPEGPQARSRAPEGPQTSSLMILHSLACHCIVSYGVAGYCIVGFGARAVSRKTPTYFI